MSGDMVPIIIVPTIFICIVFTIKIISDNIVRSKLIEKGVVDENVKHLFAKSGANLVPSSLKWGMVLIAVGGAILIAQLAPYSFRDEAVISGMFIMAGLALIVYYFLASKMANKSKEDSL